MGRDHTCALLLNGSIRCFGGAESAHARADARGRVDYNSTKELGEIEEIVAGADFTCVRSTAVGVHCWGRIPGEIEPVAEPKRIADLEATSIAASSGALCAVRPSGKVACWGDNRGKNIHIKGPANVERPTDVDDIEPALSVAMGGESACALLTIGKVMCWGGSDSWSGRPNTEYDLADAVSVTGGGLLKSHFCALRSTGNIRCWGDGSTGANAQKYNGSADIDGDFLDVHAGGDFACARRRRGDVECWGSNDAGQLAQPFEDVVPNPAAIAGASGALAIAAAESALCVVLADKTARCFGPNPEEPISTKEGPRDVVAVTRADGLLMGGSIECALTDGLPTCWGHNRASQMISTDPTVLGPSTFASLGGLKQLAIGPEHACSLSKEGAVTCWGGLGKDRAVPAPVRGISRAAAALALGIDEGCALLDEGTVACFPLRDPAAGARSRARFAAQKVVGARGAVAIARGERHGCAVDMRGAVMCWGAGGSLELGRREQSENGLGTAEVVPGIDQAVELALGDDFSCARRRDGTVWCWGRNDRGQLGDGSFADRAEPRVVPGLLGVTSLRAGSGHACALTRQKEVLCWGDNRMRQIRAGAALLSTTGVTVASNAGASPQRAP